MLAFLISTCNIESNIPCGLDILVQCDFLTKVRKKIYWVYSLKSKYWVFMNCYKVLCRKINLGVSRVLGALGLGDCFAGSMLN